MFVAFLAQYLRDSGVLGACDITALDQTVVHIHADASGSGSGSLDAYLAVPVKRVQHALERIDPWRGRTARRSLARAPPDIRHKEARYGMVCCRT